MRSRRASKRMRTKLAATASRSALPSIAAACSTKVRNGSSEGAASAPFTQQAAMRGSAAAVDAAHRPPTLLPQMPARPSDGSPTTRSTKQRYAAAISTSTWIRCSSRVSPGPALGQQGGESPGRQLARDRPIGHAPAALPAEYDDRATRGARGGADQPADQTRTVERQLHPFHRQFRQPGQAPRGRAQPCIQLPLARRVVVRPSARTAGRRSPFPAHRGR